MISYSQYDKALKIVLKYHEQIKKEVKDCELGMRRLMQFRGIRKEDPIVLSHLSTRTLNILLDNFSIYKGNSEAPILELERISKTDFMMQKNAGPKSLNELLELCAYTGIKMKE